MRERAAGRDGARVPVTLDDVALAAGVSTATVSRVINNFPRVVDTTRQRVLDAIERLHYTPNFASRRLAVGEPITSQTSASVLQRVIDATRARHLSVPALDSSCWLVHPDSAGRSAAVQEGEFMVNLARSLGAPAVRVVGGLSPMACR